MAPDGLGVYRHKAHRRGVKVWYGPDKARRDHFEAQILPSRHLGKEQQALQTDDTFAIEIGFHAEFADEAANQAALDAVLARRKVWSKVLGDDAEAGPFLGNDSWRRLSEVWLGVDVEDPDLAFEVASRLVDYIESVQPVLDS